MTDTIDPVALARDLIACPSVTPADGGAQALLATTLEQLGFTVKRYADPDGDRPDVPNLLAWRGDGGPHIAFAGHTDVVPPGDGWTYAPFEPAIAGDLLYGRGAVDMKGAIACAVAAAAALPSDHDGRISFLITGDEEGPSTAGTIALMRHMTHEGILPDCILVGEPTSQHRLGDMIKIGRRGSVNVWITVTGTQGHVAYPHLADNPATPLIALLARLKNHVLDSGTEWFQPSNLEITDLAIGNPATNVIPGEARARLNIRFNDAHRGAALVDWIRAEAAKIVGPRASVRAEISGESFITAPGAFSDLISDAIAAETGLSPELSTTGGTSDARFLSTLCPTVEFGLPNATMHKLDEAVAIADLPVLTRIYRRIFEAALGIG